MQRKQFGKRGAAASSVPQFGGRQTAYAAATPLPAYAASGNVGGLSAFEDNGSFSVGRALTMCLGVLFSFQGRIGRLQYWVIGAIRFFVFAAILTAFVVTLSPRIEGLPEEEAGRAILTFAFGTVHGLFMVFLLLATLVCLWSLEVRRSHDRDASGLLLLILLIPIIGSLYGIYIFIANGFFAGTPGPNRFDTAQSQAQVFD